MLQSNPEHGKSAVVINFCDFENGWRAEESNRVIKGITGLKHVTPIDFVCRTRTNVQFNKYQIWKIKYSEQSNQIVTCFVNTWSTKFTRNAWEIAKIWRAGYQILYFATNEHHQTL